MDDTDDVIRTRLDAVASTVSATRSETLGQAIATFENHQRRRQRQAIASALVLLIGIIAVGTAVARRSPDDDHRLASGSQEDAMSYLSRSADKSLATNTFRSTTSYEVSSTDPNYQAYVDCAQGSAINARSTVSVDVRNDISVLLDPATARPLVITSPAFDAVSSSAFPGVAIATPWVAYDRLDPRMTTAVLNMNTKLALQLFFAGTQSQMTPADQLADITASAASVTAVGDEEIAGVMTRHLVMTLDPTKVEGVVRRRSESAAESADEVARQRGHSPPGTFPFAPDQPDVPPVDVWVGTDDELIRKIAFNYDLDPTGGESAGSGAGEGSTEVRMVITFSDYGEPLPAQPPRRDETVALGSLPASALVGSVGPSLACNGLPFTTDDIDPATAKAVLECEQTARRHAVEGRTIDQLLAGLPEDGVPSLDPSDPSTLEMSKCYEGLPPPDLPPTPSGGPTSVLGPPCPAGTHEPAPDDPFPMPSSVGRICIDEGPPDEATLKCLQEALTTMPPTTTDPNSPLAPQCAPPAWSVP